MHRTNNASYLAQLYARTEPYMRCLQFKSCIRGNSRSWWCLNESADWVRDWAKRSSAALHASYWPIQKQEFTSSHWKFLFSFLVSQSGLKDVKGKKKKKISRHLKALEVVLRHSLLLEVYISLLLITTDCFCSNFHLMVWCRESISFRHAVGRTFGCTGWLIGDPTSPWVKCHSHSHDCIGLPRKNSIVCHWDRSQALIFTGVLH